MRALLCLGLIGCASTLQSVHPTEKVTAVALASKKEGIEAQAMTRAALMKNGVAFVLEKGTLKLAKPKPVEGGSVSVAKRQPSGFTAQITFKRGDDELDRLEGIKVVHVEGEGTSSDAGKAQMKAESQAFRDAITRTAKALGKKDSVLKGRFKIINYSLAEEGRLVTVSADIFVAFLQPPAPKAAPQPAAPTGAAQPVATAAKPKPRNEEDEPEDGKAPTAEEILNTHDAAEAEKKQASMVFGDDATSNEMVFDTPAMVFDGLE